MATKQYKVMREVHDHDRFLASHPDFNDGYQIYLVEANSSSYSRQSHYIVTREKLWTSQYLTIDDDELTGVSVGRNSTQLGNYRLLSYRPANSFENHFRIVAHSLEGEAVEKFGNRELDRRFVTMYDAERAGLNGYKGQLVRIFSSAAYSRGMSIPANEAIPLPARQQDDRPYYLHDTDSKAYKDRIWKALKSFF